MYLIINIKVRHKENIAYVLFSGIYRRLIIFLLNSSRVLSIKEPYPPNLQKIVKVPSYISSESSNVELL